MSLDELKKASMGLPPKEKRELAENLRKQADPQLAERRTRVTGLMREMDAGRKYAQGDFERLDRELAATGL